MGTREWRGGINQKTGIDMYTLLYIKQITNKNLLYSTKNFTQYSVIIYMGKESKKRVDICITDSPCSIIESSTTLSINYTPMIKKEKNKTKNTEFT